MSAPNKFGSNLTKSIIAMIIGADGAPFSASNPMPVTPIAPTPGTSNTASFVRGLKAPASTSVPEALAATGTYVQSVVIVAMRAARVANTGSVFIDSVSADSAQLIELSPGSTYTITAPPGKVIDLGGIYVDAATLTDGVFFFGVV
jgi:hypothetical protein